MKNKFFLLIFALVIIIFALILINVFLSHFEKVDTDKSQPVPETKPVFQQKNKVFQKKATEKKFDVFKPQENTIQLKQQDEKLRSSTQEGIDIEWQTSKDEVLLE